MRPWIAVFVLCGISAFARAQEEDARKILANAIKAHGGDANLKKLRVAQVSYRMSVALPGMESDVNVVETYQLPTQMKKVIKGKSDGKDVDVTWVINGDNYWFREGRAKAFRVDERPNLERSYRTFLVIEQLDVYQSRDVGLTTLAEKKMDGRIVLGIHAKAPANTDFYFDKETGLLAKTTHKSFLPKADGEKAAKESLQESFFDDYKTIQGARLPHRLTTLSDGKKTAEIRITAVKMFDKLDDSIFAEP